MKFKIITFFLGILIYGFNSHAQETVRGVVKDIKTGDFVSFATIRCDDKPKSKTDFDGAFSFTTTAGKHKLTISNKVEGYIDKNIEIEVVAGKVYNIVVELGKDSSVLQLGDVEYVFVRNTGTATTIAKSDEQRMEDPAASDGLPKATIQNSGVPTAAEAVQMVPGASVQDGKNVFVRGLGDRYTKTILNGMDIPGLDPDRNAVQLDIFPAVIIDNITVYKTFTPNLTGDFTGGLINIETKDFPDRKTIYFKGGLGYNTNATFNPNYISYQGGAIDFLGFDDGSRKLPFNSAFKIMNPADTQQDPGEIGTYEATSQFSDVMAAQKAFSFMNQSYAFSMGDQKNFQGKKDTLKTKSYGYNFALNYRNSNTLYEDVEYNEYLRDPDKSVTALFQDRGSRGVLAQNDVMWTALLGQSYKAGSNKFSFNLFHTQNATTTAAELTEINYDSNQATLLKDGLQFTQRSISNANLYGRHILDTNARWKLTWNLTPTYSRIYDPDIRSTALELSDTPGPNGEDVYLWEESVGAEVRRIFRDLREYNVSGKADMNFKFNQWDSLESTLSFGFLNTYKSRTFDVSEYVFRLDGMSNVVPNDPDWFFLAENIWSADKDSGVYAVGQQEKANIYDATQNVSSVYIMNELPINENFNITYGARAEKAVNRYTGENNTGTISYNNAVVLDELNILPSVNMVYKIRKDPGYVNEDGDTLKTKRNTNIRAAYTQTLARPSFREISISQIYDPIQGRRYLGNIDLKQTLIHNADLRYEFFFGRTEIISLSAFYKKFINPIEVVANVAAPNEFKPVNAGEANVYGAEFEIRKAIGFNNERNRHQSFVLGANFTYVISQIDMTKVETILGSDTLTEYDVRLDYAREGEVVSQYRQMYGQSPYIINAFATYKNDSLGLMVNLTYNVQGPKLAVIGVGGLPDVYEQPFHSLNMKVSKTFGKIREGEVEPRWKGSFRAQNLLNNAKRKFYTAFEADSKYFEYLHPGLTFSASVAYTLR